METLQKQTSLFGEEELTSLLVVFPASHTAQPGNGLEKQTNATCGQKCLEQYERYNHATSWGKTFMGLLIGTGDWFSTRCKLTWKLSDTKYNRSYFRLVPSTLPTEEKGFGLLPTIQTQGLKVCNQNGKTQFIDLKMLPTPQARDWKGARHETQSCIPNLIKKGLLPTPDAASGKTGYMGKNRQGKQQNLETVIRNSDDSLNSQLLNPLFVGEMMGFPPNWTELPFLNGETNQ